MYFRNIGEESVVLHQCHVVDFPMVPRSVLHSLCGMSEVCGFPEWNDLKCFHEDFYV